MSRNFTAEKGGPRTREWKCDKESVIDEGGRLLLTQGRPPRLQTGSNVRSMSRVSLGLSVPHSNGLREVI